jgi:hypothetical protein
LSAWIAIVCTINLHKSAVTRSTGKIIGIPLLLILLIAPAAILAIRYHQQFEILISKHDQTQSMDDENPYADQPDLSVYRPFAKGNNKLVITEKPTLEISENHPKIGGALAFYPIYAAAVQAIYKNFAPVHMVVWDFGLKLVNWVIVGFGACFLSAA